jgi:hypothetical protein
LLLCFQAVTVMSVTIYPATHKANAFSNETTFAKDIARLLYDASNLKAKNIIFLQSSLAKTDLEEAKIRPRNNGFFHTCIDAYSSHKHLSVRPEDVWVSILTQLSSYINANAEALRHKFVKHDGKKLLEVWYDYGDRYTVPIDVFADKIGDLLEKNIIDPDLREWILPHFSTTTPKDTVVASILMMASMQSYFE